jgi:hypothetical protein
MNVALCDRNRRSLVCTAAGDIEARSGGLSTNLVLRKSSGGDWDRCYDFFLIFLPKISPKNFAKKSPNIFALFAQTTVSF